MSNIEVFAHFLKNCSNDFAETSYLDSLDHYLQVSNWSHVQENSFSPSKIGPNVENFGFRIKKIGFLRKTFIKKKFFNVSFCKVFLKGSPYIVLTSGKK